MRRVLVFLLSACAAWPQFRGTGQLVVAPTTVTDSKGRMVDGLNPSDLILFDNNVPVSYTHLPLRVPSGE